MDTGPETGLIRRYSPERSRRWLIINPLSFQSSYGSFFSVAAFNSASFAANAAFFFSSASSSACRFLVSRISWLDIQEEPEQCIQSPPQANLDCCAEPFVAEGSLSLFCTAVSIARTKNAPGARTKMAIW